MQIVKENLSLSGVAKWMSGEFGNNKKSRTILEYTPQDVNQYLNKYDGYLPKYLGVNYRIILNKEIESVKLYNIVSE